MSKEITVDQVASQKFDKKKASSLCWIIIHNVVYDVTKFLNEVSVPNHCSVSLLCAVFVCLYG